MAKMSEKERALQRLKDAKEDLKKANIAERKELHKKDARGKILIGGYVLSFVKAGDKAMEALIAKMLAATTREEDLEAIKIALERTKAKTVDPEIVKIPATASEAIKIAPEMTVAKSIDPEIVESGEGQLDLSRADETPAQIEGNNQ